MKTANIWQGRHNIEHVLKSVKKITMKSCGQKKHTARVSLDQRLKNVPEEWAYNIVMSHVCSGQTDNYRMIAYVKAIKQNPLLKKAVIYNVNRTVS